MGDTKPHGAGLWVGYTAFPFCHCQAKKGDAKRLMVLLIRPKCVWGRGGALNFMQSRLLTTRQDQGL